MNLKSILVSFLFVFLFSGISYSTEEHNIPKAVSMADSFIDFIFVKNDTILKSYNLRPNWINKKEKYEEYLEKINDIKMKINSNHIFKAIYYEPILKSGVINIYYKMENNKEYYLCVSLNRQDSIYQFCKISIGYWYEIVNKNKINQ